MKFYCSSAIGNHDEGTGQPVNNVAAAIWRINPSVHRTRVLFNKNIAGTYPDRVNYAVERSFKVDGKQAGFTK